MVFRMETGKLRLQPLSSLIYNLYEWHGQKVTTYVTQQRNNKYKFKLILLRNVYLLMDMSSTFIFSAHVI
jgi:hypothetical protein